MGRIISQRYRQVPGSNPPAVRALAEGWGTRERYQNHANQMGPGGGKDKSQRREPHPTTLSSGVKFL